MAGVRLDKHSKLKNGIVLEILLDFQVLLG